MTIRPSTRILTLFDRHPEVEEVLEYYDIEVTESDGNITIRELCRQADLELRDIISELQDALEDPDEDDDEDDDDDSDDDDDDDDTEDAWGDGSVSSDSSDDWDSTFSDGDDTEDDDDEQTDFF